MNNSINMSHLLAIGAGATLGAWGRWALGLAYNAILPNLALGTLIANLSGGFMMGLALALMGVGSFDQPTLRLFITTGFLGGLTTFSAFSGESLTLLHKQEYCWAAIHASSHVFGALLMAALGFTAVQYFKA